MSALYKLADILDIPVTIRREGIACHLKEINANHHGVDAIYHAPCEVFPINAEIKINLQLDS